MFATKLLARPIACTTCGFDLRGLPSEELCPECGTAIKPTLRSQGFLLLEAQSKRGVSLAARICCICSFIILCSTVALATGRVLDHPSFIVIGTVCGVLSSMLSAIARDRAIRTIPARGDTERSGSLVPGRVAVPVFVGGALWGWVAICAASIWSVNPWSGLLAQVFFLCSVHTTWYVESGFVRWLSDIAPTDAVEHTTVKLRDVCRHCMWVTPLGWGLANTACIFGMVCVVTIAVVPAWLGAGYVSWIMQEEE